MRLTFRRGGQRNKPSEHSPKAPHRPHHLQDGGVAAHDERQAAEAFDAVGDPHRKLLVEVFATALRSADTEEGERSERSVKVSTAS